MSGLLRTLTRRAAPSVRHQIVVQKANLYAGPAKGKVGAVESVIGIGLFSLAILGPAGWILAHLEDYKKKE